VTQECIAAIPNKRFLNICLIWSSWCDCNPKPQTPSSLASSKSRLALPFWYRCNQAVLKKRPLNGCSNSCGSSSCSSNHHYNTESVCVCSCKMHLSSRTMRAFNCSTSLCINSDSSAFYTATQYQSDSLYQHNIAQWQLTVGQHCADYAQCFTVTKLPSLCLQCFDAVGWAAVRASGL